MFNGEVSVKVLRSKSDFRCSAGKPVQKTFQRIWVNVDRRFNLKFARTITHKYDVFAIKHNAGNSRELVTPLFCKTFDIPFHLVNGVSGWMVRKSLPKCPWTLVLDNHAVEYSIGSATSKGVFSFRQGIQFRLSAKILK